MVHQVVELTGGFLDSAFSIVDLLRCADKVRRHVANATEQMARFWTKRDRQTSSLILISTLCDMVVVLRHVSARKTVSIACAESP